MIGGVDVTGRRPRDRNIAQVFQFPVLYETLTVARNLAFALENRGLDRRQISERIAVVAGLLEIDAVMNRRPAALSMFEKQKTAIGRALVRKDVAAVLLDEPLTAVEPAAKWQLRRALKAVHRELDLTLIYVTHDQTEALTFADRVSVLHEGKILQTGTPQDLVERPAHEHVGYFIGSPGMNFLALGAKRTLGFRPDWARIIHEPAPDARPVTIVQTQTLGTRDGERIGIVTARCDGTEIKTRQRIEPSMGREGWLDIERQTIFQDGWRRDA